MPLQLLVKLFNLSSHWPYITLETLANVKEA